MIFFSKKKKKKTGLWFIVSSILILVIFLLLLSVLLTRQVEYKELTGRVISSQSLYDSVTRSDNPVWGDGKNKILFFCDITEGGCREAFKHFDQIKQTNKKEFSLVWKYLLAKTNEKSETWNKSAMCAGFQGKFWDFLRKAFVLSDFENYANIFQIGEEIGLDGKRFEKCFNSEADFEKLLEQDRQDAIYLQVDTIPKMYIGSKVLGSQALEQIEEVFIQEFFW